jgi:hypothetical protein
MAPQDAIRDAGSNVTFSVAATGSAPLFYQWKFNDVDITGENGTNYTHSNLQTNDSGVYSVTVSNVAGVATASATLMVNSPLPPQITFITMLSDGRAYLEMAGEPGTYFIEGSSNLTNWSQLSLVTNTTGAMEFIDSETNLFMRFYRARSAQ